jgi:hypothetical protein
MATEGEHGEHQPDDKPQEDTVEQWDALFVELQEEMAKESFQEQLAALGGEEDGGEPGLTDAADGAVSGTGDAEAAVPM